MIKENSVDVLISGGFETVIGGSKYILLVVGSKTLLLEVIAQMSRYR